jgi:required for meiotic nuclear division protein 1
MNTIHLEAYHIAEDIDLKGVRETYTGKLLINQKSELFYQIGEQEYLYIFDYGVVVFANFRPEDMNKTFSYLEEHCIKPTGRKVGDDYKILVEEQHQVTFQHNELIVPTFSDQVLRIVMFSLAQSIALDYYSQVGEELMTEVRRFSKDLEHKGRVGISKKAMLKFIGKSLNIKNSVVENLYIFDSPNMVWDNEYLDKLNQGLTQFFEIKTRFRELEYGLSYIDDNLDVFRDLMHHRESSILEWIIIILILVEVFDMIVTKIWFN